MLYKHYDKKPGRPSLNKQYQMEEMMLPYFQQGLTAFSVSKMPNKPNIKTVSRIFKKFARILDRELDRDVDKAQREVKARLIFSFDKNLSIIQDQIQELLDYKKSRREHYDLRVLQLKEQGRQEEVTPYKPDLAVEKVLMQLIHYLAELQDAKAANESTPTMHQSSEEATIRYLKGRNQRAMRARRQLEKEENRIKELRANLKLNPVPKLPKKKVGSQHFVA